MNYLRLVNHTITISQLGTVNVLQCNWGLRWYFCVILNGQMSRFVQSVSLHLYSYVLA